MTVRLNEQYGTETSPTRLAPPIKANVVIDPGEIVVVDATGHAIAAATATGLIPLGKYEGLEALDNTGGANAAFRVPVRPGPYLLANSAGADEVLITDIGKDCFFVNSGQVAKTDGGATRSTAGKVLDVKDGKVAVSIGPR